MEWIREELFKNKDEKYKNFQSSLIPTLDKDRIIGVRAPIWQSIAKQIIKNGEDDEFLFSLPHYYLEENNLHAAILSKKRCSFEETLMLTEKFLPYIDNWATCDSFLPAAFKDDPEKVLPHINRWLKSEHTYTVRFAIVLLFKLFLKAHFRPEINNMLKGIKTDDYYINMALAWYYSVALVEQYDHTIKILEEKSLSKFVQNKSIQKTIDSYRISNKTKDYLRTLRIR